MKGKETIHWVMNGLGESITLRLREGFGWQWPDYERVVCLIAV